MDSTSPLMRAGQRLAERSLGQLLSLEGRVAVVTGAARGIGLAISQRLAEAGALVVMSDLDSEGLNAAIGAAAKGWRARLTPCRADVTLPAQIEALADHAQSVGGRLDIWVNNAGIFPLTGPVAAADDTTFIRTLMVNVAGPFAASREAARRMPEGGVLINIASISGLRGQKFMTAYSASKHALVGMTRSLALELGPQNIRVIGIAPGLVLTPGVQMHLDKLRQSGGSLQAAPAAAPLGRPCLPDDIARVALFAASDLAAMMSGVILPVDGGGGA